MVREVRCCDGDGVALDLVMARQHVVPVGEQRGVDATPGYGDAVRVGGGGLGVGRGHQDGFEGEPLGYLREGRGCAVHEAGACVPGLVREWWGRVVSGVGEGVMSGEEEGSIFQLPQTP